MTYLQLIDKAEKLLKKKGCTKSVILNIIYLASNDIKNMTDLSRKVNDEIPHEELEKIMQALNDFVTYDKPISYCLNSTFFCDTIFKVHDHVLPPRSETEEWTNYLINLLKDYGELNVLDLCCGTGAIGLSLKKALPNLDVTLSDISKMAVENTLENSELLGVEATVVLSNLFEELANKKYDVIVCNPPYVDINYPIDTSVSKFEPYNAIYAPNRGLWYYDTILKNIKKHLNNKYIIMMEVGFNLAGEVSRLVNIYLNEEAKILLDSNGIERVVVVNRME